MTDPRSLHPHASGRRQPGVGFGYRLPVVRRVVGSVVGTVIVAQTLYSSTKDHLDEFATLRAMGSSKRYIYSVIVYQAVINAVIN